MNYWHRIYEILRFLLYITQVHVPVILLINTFNKLNVYFLMYHLQKEMERNYVNI